MQKYLIALISACFAVSGAVWAQTGSSDRTERYERNYKAIVTRYRERMKAQGQPWSVGTASPKERVAMQARFMDKVSKDFAGYERELKALTAPRAYADLHRTTLAYFGVAKRGQRRVAAAFRSGSTAQVQKVSRENDTAERLALQRMRDALHKSGGDLAKLP